MGALVVGTVLAIGALAFVLYPLFYAPPPRTAAKREEAPAENLAVAALREIEFDRVTGKLSDTDYQELKAQYTREAITEMRGGGGSSIGTALPSDDEVETAVRAYRQRAVGCPTCGPRPEPDALFCSTCGRYLNDRCADCGTPVEALDARYCVNCGRRLAA